MTHRVVLAEDNFLLREGLRGMLATVDSIDVVAGCTDLPETLPGREVTVSVLSGPQQSDFPAEASAILFAASWKISAESDRRGIRLEGPPLPLRRAPDIPPEGTALGGIQVPANGQPIVLGPDRPVTGGYAKIGTVVSRDWPLLAQAVPGATVRFRAAAFSDSGRG